MIHKEYYNLENPLHLLEVQQFLTEDKIEGAIPEFEEGIDAESDNILED